MDPTFLVAFYHCERDYSSRVDTTLVLWDREFFSFRSEELNGDTCDSCAYIDLILLEMFQYSGRICSGKLP